MSGEKRRMCGNNGAWAVILLVCVSLVQGGVTTNGNVEPADPSTWNSNTEAYVGRTADGEMNITSGSSIESKSAVIGDSSGVTGSVTIEGVGSQWTNTNSLTVGSFGTGYLYITNGGYVSDKDGLLGYWNSYGQVTVDGLNSKWENTNNLIVGEYGDGQLSISDMGLVVVGNKLKIDIDDTGNSYIDMSSGGMLALHGNGDFDGDGHITLSEFLDMIDGADTITYRDATGDYPITSGTEGVDYRIDYYSDGALDGYTVLTVGVPEPASMLLLLLCLILLFGAENNRNGKRQAVFASL